jgi:hypothetical protein
VLRALLEAPASAASAPASQARALPTPQGLERHFVAVGAALLLSSLSPARLRNEVLAQLRAANAWPAEHSRAEAATAPDEAARWVHEAERLAALEHGCAGAIANKEAA